MNKTDATAGLPAPLSLSLEDASKVAAGAAVAHLTAMPWWWFGQPAYLNAASPISQVAIGQIAGR